MRYCLFLTIQLIFHGLVSFPYGKCGSKNEAEVFARLCMIAFQDAIITNSLFVSHILDMKNLIQSMMNWACATEKQLAVLRNWEQEFLRV